ncbi:MAG: homocysteine biosynthesis protein [Deltaproteobacteria bacterium]|nr:homocysteine biosynthesis protein [Deltaproteobacteria bacterium]MBW2052374.1 homocysteine biosynthesis protein [Deltaproteobacteria bacterium]MBW2140858.1 homocysteine biosynthesis protein [Deltaproteobacteria bacterium]MBW2322417.1 homocysteine biosynthesis protein [Deltaproteobacteria bacterium]
MKVPKKYKAVKTYQEINDRIKKGKAVVLTAEEVIEVVKKSGPVKAAREVDVVTTGTFSPMCSSGAFLNFGHTKPPIKASQAWINDVPAYAGMAAVDIYIGATESVEGDPLNSVYPGEFKYGGGHVIQDLAAGNKVKLRVQAYGTDCYPRQHFEKSFTVHEIPDAVLCNPRNGYQNYNCAVNSTKKIIYTYMGPLKPHFGNANHCTSGQLSPLFNDPYFMTIGLGTRIFLGGAQGYVTWPGTQHNPDPPRGKNGVPLQPAGTMMVIGNLKEMNPRYLVGASILGYGCSLTVGLGVPIPILNEDIAQFVGVSNDKIFTKVVDYGIDYPAGTGQSLGQVSYEELFSGTIRVNGNDMPTVPLSSLKMAREIAETLKEWIQKGEFLLGEPQMLLPSVRK